jgi:hypothetical protein
LGRRLHAPQLAQAIAHTGITDRQMPRQGVGQQTHVARALAVGFCTNIRQPVAAAEQDRQVAECGHGQPAALAPRRIGAVDEERRFGGGQQLDG